MFIKRGGHVSVDRTCACYSKTLVKSNIKFAKIKYLLSKVWSPDQEHLEQPVTLVTIMFMEIIEMYQWLSTHIRLIASMKLELLQLNLRVI